MSGSSDTPVLDKSIVKVLDDVAKRIAVALDTDVLSYYGPIFDDSAKAYRDFIEGLPGQANRAKSVSIFLTTDGGLVEVVEKLVEITRYHYREVQFFVPDYAMSVGTVWCMSGNRIFMDYSSSLGPIDLQVRIVENGREQWMPALGYLDQVEDFRSHPELGPGLGDDIRVYSDVMSDYARKRGQAVYPHGSPRNGT